MAIVFVLAACLMGIRGHSAGLTTVSSQAAMDAPNPRRVVAYVETRSNGTFSQDPISSGVHEAGEDSTIEKVIKRVSQYRPRWLKGWSFPILLVLTGVGVLLLLA